MASQSGGSKPAKRNSKDAQSSKKPSTSKQTVLAVFPDTTKGDRAFQALQTAVKSLKHTELERLPFEKLDYGETAALDRFYAANVVVVDVSERHMQAALFYQLGMRESFDAKNNVVTMLESKDAFSETSLGKEAAPASMVSTTLPYTCIYIHISNGVHVYTVYLHSNILSKK